MVGIAGLLAVISPNLNAFSPLKGMVNIGIHQHSFTYDRTEYLTVSLPYNDGILT